MLAGIATGGVVLATACQAAVDGWSRTLAVPADRGAMTRTALVLPLADVPGTFLAGGRPLPGRARPKPCPSRRRLTSRPAGGGPGAVGGWRGGGCSSSLRGSG
ncbi:hypothetical protein, partial [Streptomyces sp. NPDC102462]|uniref:hypothetical protein n=1 Tax=Streptomyces sp. NPDC102462 TaxID=3366178 RepID=UPI003802C0E1